MRIIIAGGGTGGHVFPGLAVAQALQRREPRAAITWVGTAHGLEGRMGATLGYPLELLHLAPLKGRGMMARARALVQAGRACGRAHRLLRTVRPQLVIGAGGYVSGPMTLVAALRGCPTLLLEQNRIAGLTNRLLGKVARRICITYPDAIRFFSARKVVCTGNPIRARVLEEFRAAPPRTDADFVVLVFGGSQGAQAIDAAVTDALPYLSSGALPPFPRHPATLGSAKPDPRAHLAKFSGRLRFIHQYGKGTDRADLERAYAAAGIRASFHPFIDAIGAAYAQADLVICRAGASSLTELTLVARPAIVIPYPHAADDHQLWNARYFSDAGAAILCEERALSGARLATSIAECVEQPAVGAKMAAAMQQLARPDAAERIVDECLKLCEGRI